MVLDGSRLFQYPVRAAEGRRSLPKGKTALGVRGIGLLAQLAEQGTLNPKVTGSIPVRSTGRKADRAGRARVRIPLGQRASAHRPVAQWESVRRYALVVELAYTLALEASAHRD